MRILRSLVLMFSLGLSAVTVALAAEPLPPVYFNHITIYLSPAAYDALRQSEFLRNEFAGFEEETLQRDNPKLTKTGIFLFGQHTYFEFFEAGEDQRFGPTVPGELVFNMWIDDRNQLPRFQQRLAASAGAPKLIDTTRNSQHQPMYDTVISQGGPSTDFGPGMRVDTHIKGYYPDGVTREKRLQKVFLPDRLLDDITGFTLSVNEPERDRLIQQLRVYSYNIRADGARQVVSGPGITLTLLPAAPNASRTLSIDFSLNRATQKKQTYELRDGGHIGIQGSAGRWMFTFTTP
jgi:hypothetical protein